MIKKKHKKRKLQIFKAVFFPVVMYRCEELDHKER